MPVSKATKKRASRAAATLTAAPASRPSRGPVDAPGKRHRKPLPPEPIDLRLGYPTGKQMGQTSVKARWRSGRR